MVMPAIATLTLQKYGAERSWPWPATSITISRSGAKTSSSAALRTRP
jgi:hypothetical protein